LGDGRREVVVGHGVATVGAVVGYGTAKERLRNGRAIVWCPA
jgi:hypothetical protein